MVIVCKHCQKKYHVDAEQLSKLPSKMRCKACKGIIEMPKEPDARAGEVLTLTCSDCGNHYRVPANRLPAGRSTVPCKACGGTIPLPCGARDQPAQPGAAEPSSDDAYTSEEPGCEGQDDDSYDEAVPFYQNKPFLIGGGAVLLLVIGISVGIKLMGGVSDTVPRRSPVSSVTLDDTETPESDSQEMSASTPTPGTSEQTTVSGAASTSTTAVPDVGDNEPRVGITLNIPLIVSVVQTALQQTDDPNTLQMTTGLQMLQTYGLQTAHFFVTEDAQHGFLPFVCVRSVNPQMLEQVMMANNQGPEAKLKSVGPGLYAWNMEALPPSIVQNSSVPFEPYRLQFAKQWIIVGPESTVSTLTDRMDTVDQYRISQYADSLGTDQDLLRVALETTASVYESEQAPLRKELSRTPQTAVESVISSYKEFLQPYLGYLKKIKRCALAAHVSEQGTRVIRYTQQFQTAVNGRAVYQRPGSGSLC